MIRKNHYSVKTAKRFVSCQDLKAAEYIYSCNKHAEMYNNGQLIKSK